MEDDDVCQVIELKITVKVKSAYSRPEVERRLLAGYSLPKEVLSDKGVVIYGEKAEVNFLGRKKIAEPF